MRYPSSARINISVARNEARKGGVNGCPDAQGRSLYLWLGGGKVKGQTRPALKEGQNHITGAQANSLRLVLLRFRRGNPVW